MKTQIAIMLASYALGRIILHLITLCRDHKAAWHIAGIRREVGL